MIAQLPFYVIQDSEALMQILNDPEMQHCVVYLAIVCVLWLFSLKVKEQ